jgi:hypothetical protein
MNKRGLAAIVTTLLVILLVLVAVGVVWGVVRNIIVENSEKISLGRLTLDLEVNNVKINGENLEVSVTRNSGAGELVGISFAISDGFNTQVFDRETTMEQLGTEVFPFPVSDFTDIAFVKEVAAVPILETSKGKEFFGDNVDEYEDNSVTVDNKGWILVWQGLPTQARHLLEDGEKVNVDKEIKFNQIKIEGVNIDFEIIDSTAETAVLQKTIPEYFNDVSLEGADIPGHPRVKFHDLDGNKDVLLINNYLMRGYGNSWRVFYSCVYAGADSQGDYMYIGGGNGNLFPSCDVRGLFDATSADCSSNPNNANYCQDSLDNSPKDNNLGLSKREYQEARVWVKLEG